MEGRPGFVGAMGHAHGGAIHDQIRRLGGGIEFDLGTFRPVAGGRFEINGFEGFVIFITLPFALNN